MLELLTAIEEDDGIVYDDADIRRYATEVHELCPYGQGDGSHGLLAVLIRDALLAGEMEPFHISFVVFRFESGPATVDGELVSGTRWKRIFHGSGPSGNLRELRHSYWGEPDNAGYIFYPSASVIAAAFEKLKTWFDCEV